MDEDAGQGESYPCEVGEIDIPGYNIIGQWCRASVPSDSELFIFSWICTRPRGHDGPHVAHTGNGRVLAILYPQEPPNPLMQVSEGL